MTQTLSSSRQLYKSGTAACGDRTEREAAIESALVQDAQVIAFEEAPPETHLRQGIGAVLRF
jgi:hypothetical protein